MDRIHKRAIILILLAGIVVYANSFTNPFIWDDVALVEGNFLIQDWRNLPKLFITNLFYASGVESNFYRPLQSLSFMLDYSLWGFNPFGYHLSNLIFHSSAALLFYSLALRISKDRTISLIAALLFIVHPVNVEAVTYISGRADSLAALFLLLSLILFIKFRIAASLTVFGLALLAKESALIFPLILIFYLFCFPSDKTLPLEGLGRSILVDKRMKKSILLFFLLALIYVFLRLTLLCPVSVSLSSVYPFFTRLLFLIKAIGLYLSLLILPLNLHMSYSVLLPRSFFDPGVLLSFLLLIFITLGLIRAYRRRGWMIFFAGGWFFLFLLPHSGIFPINAFFAEHFIYLASMGFFLIVAVLSVRLLRAKKPFIFLPLVMLFFFAFISFRYNLIWKDPLVFYQRIVRLSPNSFGVYNNLGLIFEQRGFSDQARQMYQAAIRIKPDFSTAYINLGHLDYENGRYQPAIEWYKKALEIDPQSKSAYMYLGKAYFSQGEVDPAIEAYEKTLRLDPDLINVRNNLGIAYKQKGQYAAAIQEYELALGLDPDAAEVYNNLGVAYSKSGNYTRAEEALKKAMFLELDYADASYNLAVVYWEQGRWDEMAKQLSLTLKIDPQHELAKEQLGKLKANGVRLQPNK